MTAPKRVGIVGYGSLGQHLAQQVLQDRTFELAFVWNRTITKVKEDKSVPAHCVLENLDNFSLYKVDIIVEVAHPDITKIYGPQFLKFCNYFVGSPTTFADAEVEKSIREAASKSAFGVYIPVGALWGSVDIERMAQRGTLLGLKVTMKKHPESLKLVGVLAEKLKEVATREGEQILYEGPVRPLCELAPNNVNTMACAALAGFNLGFDKTQAALVSDKSLKGHVVVVEVTGPDKGDLGKFSVNTVRYNPAPPGAVTGQQTYASFFTSLCGVGGRGPGFHFC